jgi:esterase/lipase superfamily enzyme
VYIVTNREIRKERTGYEVFGERPNEKGPHELRLIEVTSTRGGSRVRIVPDELTQEEKKRLGLPVSKVAYGSEMVARTVFNRVRRAKKNVLLFVHGYNNDMESVVARALRLQKQFDVEVLAFSWPANGGGARGALSYKSDKRDSRASIGALDRVIEKVGHYLYSLREQAAEQIRLAAASRFAGDAETRDEAIAEALEKQCPVRVSLMLHSMGNYLFKHLMKSSIYSGDQLVFDNVILAAADANSEDHESWVDRIQFRNRLYVTINEKDSALKLSRAKLGSQQKARLGHFPYQLNSDRAVYVDFTGARYVGDSHSYFEGTPLRNAAVKKFFRQALNGETAEPPLKYDVSRNLHAI